MSTRYTATEPTKATTVNGPTNCERNFLVPARGKYLLESRTGPLLHTRCPYSADQPEPFAEPEPCRATHKLAQQAAAAPKQRSKLLAPYPHDPTTYLQATASLAHTLTMQGSLPCCPILLSLKLARYNPRGQTTNPLAAHAAITYTSTPTPQSDAPSLFAHQTKGSRQRTKKP